MGGRLVLCGTPIGNLEDISPRAASTLAAADVLACERPQRAKKLLAHLGIPTPSLVVYNEGNERRQARALVERVARGETVVLVSDAGMPGLSDPGYRLVRACADRDLPVEVVPGPSAAISALAVSGLPPGRFVFEGFLPRKASERRRRIRGLAGERSTLIFYESPHRLAESLADLAEILGPRPAALARELTKLYEEVRRGDLAGLAAEARDHPVRGEVVLVVGGASGAHRLEPPSEELARRAQGLMASGVSRREALAMVAEECGVRRRRVFDALVAAGAEREG
jgi:16S rRNA (cytidine1402-2'-O)-methyltransferase